MHTNKTKTRVVLFYSCAFVFIRGLYSSSGIDFPDFSNVKGFYFNGNAYRSKRIIRLTNADRFLAGAAWFGEKQPILAGFETTFAFRFTGQDAIQGGADGLAFVVQNEGTQAIGGLGASGGFMRSDQGAPGSFQRGISRMVAVFFDTYRNPGTIPITTWPSARPSDPACAGRRFARPTRANSASI